MQFVILPPMRLVGPIVYTLCQFPRARVKIEIS